MQHDERRVQSSPTTRGTSFAARRAACELGAGERARVHLCHAVPRVTGSCGPWRAERESRCLLSKEAVRGHPGVGRDIAIADRPMKHVIGAKRVGFAS